MLVASTALSSAGGVGVGVVGGGEGVDLVVGLQRTIAKWLTIHCPVAKMRVAACLLRVPAAPKQQQPPRHPFAVVVETASGHRVGRFEFADASTTARDISNCVGARAPGFRSAQLFMCRAVDDNIKLAPTTTIGEMCQLQQRPGTSSGAVPMTTTTTTTTTPATMAAPTPSSSSLLTKTTVELVVMKSAISWDDLLENSAVRYSDQNRKAHRIGMLGSYPLVASSTKLVTPGDTFAVVLDEWSDFACSIVTIGITLNLRAFRRGGEYSNTSSGVGRSTRQRRFQTCTARAHCLTGFVSLQAEQRTTGDVEGFAGFADAEAG